MFKRYPFVKQSNMKECAACSILMIIRYYHGNIFLNRLSEMLKIDKNGTTAYQIVEVLKQVGFEAKGVKESQLKSTKIPFIAHTIINNTYKHFIVVYEINSKYILIADPAVGIKKISHEDFLKMWTGISIVMHPIRILPREKEISPLKFIFSFFKEFKVRILKLGFLSLLVTLFSILSAFFFQSLIDNISKFKVIGVIFIFIMITHTVLEFCRNHFLIKFTKEVDERLFKRIFKQIIFLPYPYYHSHTTGEVISKVNDLTLLKDAIVNFVVNMFTMFPIFIFAGILLIDVSFKLFAVQCLVLIFLIIIMLVFHKKHILLIDNYQKNKIMVSSYMAECITGYKTIKGSNISFNAYDNFSKKYDGYLNANYCLSSTNIKQAFLKNLVYVFGHAFTLIVGISFVKSGNMTIGSLITYIMLMTLFLESVRSFVDMDIVLKQAFEALKRVLELTYYKEKMNKEMPVGDIEFKNVYFSFDDQRNVLNNLNFTIKENSKVLISGKSGSGKSTLFKLLKCYYKFSGEIVIKNKPLSSDRVVLITSDEFIFTGTIYDNLTVKNNRDLHNIMKICNVNEFLKAFDLGYYTLLEENGSNLSSGQRQRVALARALYDFDVLLIDEGFANIDSDMERKILKKLFEKFYNKIIIVISHRLDNLDLFDQYIVLDNGVIALDEMRWKEECDATKSG